jgi:hypothetical protein
MDQDAKSAFAKLMKAVQDGFAAVDKRFAGADTRFASLEAQMEKGFAAIAEDLAEVKDRLTAVESKVAGTNRRLDEEALLRTDLAIPKRVADLEEKTFGASRHPKHVPLGCASVGSDGLAGTTHCQGSAATRPRCLRLRAAHARAPLTARLGAPAFFGATD